MLEKHQLAFKVLKDVFQMDFGLITELFKDIFETFLEEKGIILYNKKNIRRYRRTLLFRLGW